MFNHSGDHHLMQLYPQKADRPTAQHTEPSTPTGPGPLPKPTKRRPRASKKTPITVLQADTNNFRSLVQQFTGCPTTAVSFNKAAAASGPVNLNFSNHHYQPQQDRYNYPFSAPSSYSQQQSLGSESGFLSFFGDAASDSSRGDGLLGMGQVSSMGLENHMDPIDQGYGSSPVRGLTTYKQADSLRWEWQQP
ncbi:hypothetical protein SAY87_008895 [Trapa incisa]|uniref:VQ domain-containing protein n=1 Tax=Trapa incisa TaxID=236973 RepID=A0AAN7K0V5_9MYRT|nr:hypothetical protein SAY87_008895 [Trapa incisa]